MSRRRNKKKSDDSKGIILIVTALILVSGIGFFAYDQNRNKIDRNKDDMCRTDDYISRETVFIIDATDYFSESQALLVKKEVQDILESSLIDERFSVYVLDDTVNKTSIERAIAVACNPGDGSNKSELTNNLRRLEQKWRQNFYMYVYHSIDNLIGEHSAKQSPIMEMIKFASVNSMYKSQSKFKRMIIISDMLHHTDSYSQYTSHNQYEKFKTLPYALEMRPQLQGVNIEILYLVRPKDIKLQNKGHINFWQQYFSEARGTITRVKAIN